MYAYNARQWYTYMPFSDRKGPPYWLREPTGDELATHLRLMTTLHKLETQSGHIEAVNYGHPQAATTETQPPPDLPKRQLSPHPYHTQEEDSWELDGGAAGKLGSQGD
jgi:hypothetical protein